MCSNEPIIDDEENQKNNDLDESSEMKMFISEDQEGLTKVL